LNDEGQQQMARARLAWLAVGAAHQEAPEESEVRATHQEAPDELEADDQPQVTYRSVEL
jgi:hypothetical protein